MKIHSPANDKLELILPQYLVRLVGLFFLLIGGGITFYLFQTFDLQCLDKSRGQANQCQRTSTHFFFYQDKISLGTIQKAVVDARKNSKGNWNYNVALVTSQGKILLSDVSSLSKMKSQEAVEQINDYLQNSDAHLHIAGIQPLWIMFFILIFPSVGLCILLLTGRVSVLFNKTTNQAVIIKKNIFQQSEQRFSLSKIKNIIIQESRSQKGQMLYRVALVLEDKTEIPLTTVYDSYLPSKVKMAKVINDFLDLNLNFDVISKKEKNINKRAITLFFVGLIVIVIILLLMR